MSRRPRVDHYRVLGVERDATASEIRRAYRHLARQHHPDVSPQRSGSQRFRALTRAYETLSNPAARARYDGTLARPVGVRSSRRADDQRTRARMPQNGAPRRGILELSPSEAADLAWCPLTLRDADGQTIVLPAGTSHGDRIMAMLGGQTLALTVRVTDRA